MNKNLLLKTYHFFSKLFATLLLIYVAFLSAFLFYQLDMHINNFIFIPQAIRSLMWLLNMCLLSLLLLGVSQFLRNVSGQMDHPGWLLRRGEFIIYIAIIVAIVDVICKVSILCIGGYIETSFLPNIPQMFTSVVLSVMIVFIKVLIMFGIAQSLRRMGYSSSKKSINTE